MIKRLCIVLSVIGTGSIAKAQPTSPYAQSSVLDGFYQKEHVPTKKLVQWVHVREADVMWEKRIWRIIDNRQKINYPLFYPLTPKSDRVSLWHLLFYYLVFEPGTITPYQLFTIDNISDKDDMFKYPIPYAPDPISDSIYRYTLRNILYECSEGEPYYRIIEGGIRIDSLDAQGNLVINPDTKVCDSIVSQDVVAWELKEDWFFDKQRSVMDVRIIGICPIVYRYEVDPATKAKKVVGTKQLLWFYFPEIRYILQNHFVFNRLNDAQRMSYDDLFWKRMFDSYIKKESNIYDRKIVDYTQGVDALLESEKIKKFMMEFEHDVWDL